MMIMRRMWFSAVFISVALWSVPAMAQDDGSQRLLPLPESGVTDLPQHMELLKRLRSLVESREKNSGSEETPEKPVDSNSARPPAGLSGNDRTATQNNAPENPEGAGPLQPQQFQQLEDALKKLADRLPPGFVPPNLNSIPPEQLRKTIEDPAVQQQMRKMLEQFSKDGVLPPPPSRENPGGESLPLPPRPRQNSSSLDPGRPNSDESTDRDETNVLPENTGERTTGERNTSEKNTGEESEGEINAGEKNTASSPPPAGSLKSLRDFLKKIYEGSPPSGSRSDNSAPVPSENIADSKPAAPRQPLRRRDRQKGSQSPSSPSQPQPSQSPSSQYPSPQPQSSQSQMPQPGSPLQDYGLRNGNESPDERLPENRGDSGDKSGNNSESLRPNPENRPRGVSPPVIAPPVIRSPQPSNPLGSSPMAPRGESAEASEYSQRQINELRTLIEQMKKVSEQQNEGSGSAGTGTELNEAQRSSPDVSEFLKQQLENTPFRQTPQNGPPQDGRPQNSLGQNSPRQNSLGPEVRRQDVPKQKARGPGGEEGRNPVSSNDGASDERPGDALNRQSDKMSPGSGVTQGLPDSSGTSDSTPDARGTSRAAEIREDLERRGFGETLRRIVEKARKESRQPKPESDSETDLAVPDVSPSNSGGGQLSESMNRMLGGLKDEIVEIAKDAKFDSPSNRSPRSGNRSQSSSSESGSMLDDIRKSASEILAGPTNTTGGRTASGASSGAGSSANDFEFDFTPALVLAGLLAAATLGFLGLKHLKLRDSDPTLQFAGPPLQPSEIQSRADVVRAFHEFALRSTRSVQSWWTHRAVERVIASTAPEKKAAVETLANAYEQARYLPQDQELTEDQIQSARTAFQQCTTHGVKPG